MLVIMIIIIIIIRGSGKPNCEIRDSVYGNLGVAVVIFLMKFSIITLLLSASALIIND